MRIFVAIPIDLEQIDMKPLLSIKSVSHYHCTLAFFGDVSNEEFVYIKQKLQTKFLKPFTLKTKSQLDYFGSKNNSKVWYIPIQYSKKLQELQQKIQNLFKNKYHFGKFQPHITVARVKRKLTIQEIKQFKKVQLPKKEINVSELELIQSILTENGQEYFVRKKIRL